MVEPARLNPFRIPSVGQFGPVDYDLLARMGYRVTAEEQLRQRARGAGILADVRVTGWRVGPGGVRTDPYFVPGIVPGAGELVVGPGGPPGSFDRLNPLGRPGSVIGGGRMADLGLMATGGGGFFGGFGDFLGTLAGIAAPFVLANNPPSGGTPIYTPPAQYTPPGGYSGVGTGGLTYAAGPGQGQSLLGCPPRIQRTTAEVRPDPCGASPRIWMDMGSVASALPSKAFTYHRRVNKLAKKAARPARRKSGRR